MKRRAFFLSVFLSFISSCLTVPSVHAQYRASIQGVVTDSQGAVIPGATVVLTDKETNRAITGQTNDGGVYNFNALPPHHFSMSVEKGGFKKKVLDDVAIMSEQANAVNVQLEVGQSSETVTVSAETAPLIDTQTAQIGGTINPQQIQTLPSFGRDLYQLVQLASRRFWGRLTRRGGPKKLGWPRRDGLPVRCGLITTTMAGSIFSFVALWNSTNPRTSSVVTKGLGIVTIASFGECSWGKGTLPHILAA